MTDQNEEYTQDTSQEQNDAGGPEIPKTPETPKIGERVRNFFGGNKREKNPKQETPQPQEEPKQEQPKPRKYKDIWSMYETDAYDENVPWQKEVKERMQADPEFKERWGKFNGWFSSGVKGNPIGYSKINKFNEDRSDEEKNWRRYKKAYGLSQDDDIDFGTDEYDRPIADAKGFKDLFEYSRDPTAAYRNDFGRDGFNNFWDTRGRYNKLNTTKYGIFSDDPSYNDWYWSRNPFRLFNYKSSSRVDATDDDRKLEELSRLMNGNRWGAGSARSARLTNRGEFDDISANLYQDKRVRDIFGDEEDPDFFKFMDTIRDSEDPKDRALYDLYWKRGTPGMPSEKDYDRLKEDYYHYREQQHGIGRDGKPINPQQEQPQPGPTQEQSQAKEVGGPAGDVSATVDGKPVNAEIVTENNKLPATGREGVQDAPQDVTPYKGPKETYVEPDNHPGPYTGAPKELGAGPEQKTGDGAVPAPALGAAGPPGGGKEPADEDDDDKGKGTFQAQYDLKAERNALAKQHATKFLNAFAQTAAEMGGQMASKGWDLAGNIVKMTFTQPHAMSSTSRMIGTAMSALQTAEDFADRSVQKYGIDVNADPNLMKNTIRYKLYKREAEMGKNTVGNTFRTISESLGNMGLQDASQMTPDQLDQHVQDMRAEADRLTQALKDPKLSNSERSLIKAQAQHLQGYMDGLAKQGAGMAQDQRIAARRQKRQDLATRRQNYQVLADGSPNPYREALEWADPRFGIEVDPQTGRPTNPSAYNRMLNAVITQRQNEAAAAERAGKKLDPAREKWFNDLQNKIYNDIQAMKQDKAENPLRGRAEIYARIGRVAPGFEKYIDNIEQTGTFPSNSTQSTRAIRKVLSDYLFELKDKGLEKTPEYNHALALLTSMDKYNNMKKLMSRIAGVMPHGAERAKRIHEATENDPYVNEDFSDNGKIKDYTKLVEAYAHLMKHLHRDPVKGGNFNPEDKEYQYYEGIFNDNLTYFVNKWFPGAGWGKGKESDDSSDESGDKPGDKPGDEGKKDEQKTLDDIFNPEVIEEDTNGITDEFIFNELRRLGGYAEEESEVPKIRPKGRRGRPRNVKQPKKQTPGTPSANKMFDDRFVGGQDSVLSALAELGIETEPEFGGRIKDPAVFQELRDDFIRNGVSPEKFDRKFGFVVPLDMLSPAAQVIAARKKLAYGPEGAQSSIGGAKIPVKKLRALLHSNSDLATLMARKVRGGTLTEEEELNVQKVLFDAGIIKRIKTKKGDVPPEQEQDETPVEEEVEQPKLPAVTENDFIKPEVASQFKDAKNIESINAGIAATQSLNRDERAGGYNDILWGLENEVGKEALFADKDYFNLVKTAFMDGSPRAIGLVADAFSDPKDKLQALMAGRMAAPKSNESAKMLADFLNKYGKDYDVGAINTIINNAGSLVQQAQSDKDREKIINNFLDNDLDGSVFNHKEGEKKEDETPSEEEAVDPAKFAEEVVGSLDPSLFPSGEKDEVPVDPNSTDQFEAPSDKKPETTESFEESPEEKINTKLKEKIAKQDEDIKFAHANLPMPEGKDMDGLVKDLMSEFNVPKGLGQKSKPPTVRSRIGKWLEKNGYLEEGTSDKPQNHKVIDGLFAMMCRNGLQKTLSKTTNADPNPEGKRDDTDEGKALHEEAEHKKAIEGMILKVGPQGDVDDPSTLQKEFDDHVSKLTKKLQDKYKADFQEAIGKRKISNIGKGAFKSPDPSKWLDEIRATEDAAELEKMKGAFEKYIQASDEKVRKGMQDRLDRAYADSEVHKVADKIVDRLVDRILSHSSLTDFEDNKDEYRKEFDKSLVGLSDEKKDERKKLWKDRLMAASDAKKAIANHFPDADAKGLVGEDKAALVMKLSGDVLEKYKGDDPNEGPNALDAYKKILKFVYPGSDIDKLTKGLMDQIAKVVKPPVNKSLSVRDLFRARNPDWE